MAWRKYFVSFSFLKLQNLSVVCATHSNWMKIRRLNSIVDPTKLFFLQYFFFGVKLGHFTINNFFLYVTKMQAYQRKTEKFFVSEEKQFGRIDSCMHSCNWRRNECVYSQPSLYAVFFLWFCVYAIEKCPFFWNLSSNLQ
jgi:hypothetical protein